MADMSVLDVVIKRMSTEWTPVSEALPKSGMPVLAWNGEPHLATWTARFTTEDYLDDESYMAECDDQDNWWMREGWYEQIVTEKMRPQGYDFIVAMIEEPPVTHWMLLPAGPEAARS